MNDSQDSSICVLCDINRANIKMDCCNKIFCDECLKKNLVTNNKCPNCRKLYRIEKNDASCSEYYANCSDDCYKVIYCIKNIRHTGCRYNCISYRYYNNDSDDGLKLSHLYIPITILSIVLLLLYFSIFNHYISFVMTLLIVLLSVIMSTCCLLFCCGCLTYVDHLSINERVVNV